MRFLLYNIRYGTGGENVRLPWSGYFNRTDTNLGNITRFIKGLSPDIVGLVEVDAGSYRAGRQNQAAKIASELGHHHAYRSKYGENALTKRIPLVRKQGNAFLAKDSIHNVKFHYFKSGFKKMAIELEMQHINVFLVHLPLMYGARQRQLGDLYDVVKNSKKPVIVAGDFNTILGYEEMTLFLAATKLQNPNREGLPSFPTWHPKRQLDFILHSEEISVHNFSVLQAPFSDHLPLLMDFSVQPSARTAV